MRFFVLQLVIAFVGLSCAWGQTDLPLSGWTPRTLQALLYAAIPLLLLAIAIAWTKALRRMNRAPADDKLAALPVGVKPLLWPLVVLIAGLGVTAYRVQLNERQVHADAWQRFQHEMDRAEANIQARFESLLPALRGLRGMVVARGDVSGSEFRDWVASREIEQEFPGVSGFGLVQRVVRKEVPMVLTQPAAVGQAALNLKNGDASEDLFLVKYAEPLESNRHLLGWDFGADPVARAAAERAMRSGRPALSAGVTLGRNAPATKEILYLLPLYSAVKVPSTEAERVRLFRGWAFSPIVIGDLMAQAVASSREVFDFSVWDSQEADKAQLLFESRSHPAAPLQTATLPAAPLFNAERLILVSGQFFALRVRTTEAFGQSIDFNETGRLAFFGSALSVLASLTVGLVLVGRTRAKALALAMTGDLDRLAMVAQRTSNAVVISDMQQHITWVNEGFTRITGYSAEEAIGKNVGELLRSDNADPAAHNAIVTALRAGQACHQILINRAKDGHDYWVDLEIQPLVSRDGVVTGFMSLESDVTTQMQAKEALAREKERADGILLGTNVGTWQFNAQSQETRVNEQWSLMLGYTPEEVGSDVSAFWNTHVHPDDLVRSNNGLAACLRGDTQAYCCELRVQCKDGHWIWILSRAKVLTRTSQGHPEWFAGIHTDITESKRTEEKLRDMEAFLHRAGRAAGVGAWQMDLATQKTTWSDLTCEIHGVEPGFQPTQEQVLSFYPPQAQEQLKAAAEQAVVTCMGWDLTLPFTNVEGVSMWVRSVGEVEFDDSGPVRLVGAFQDVSAAQAASDRLAKTTATLQTVLDSAVDVAVIATDLNRTITVFNRGAERLLGYEAEALVGCTTPNLFFDPGQLAVVRESLALSLGRAPTVDEVFANVVESNDQGEWTFVRKDGSTLTVSLMISPMLGAEGELIGHLGIAYDISHQKDYEDSLRKAMVQAEQANVAKSQFLANMSHEIRTPMNAILGMLNLLHNTPLSERQRDYADKTEGAARSLLVLLNDILDFSKVEAGKMQLDPEPFKVDQLLADLSVILSSNLGSKNVDVLFDIDPAIPDVLVGDAQRIKQILINLGGNAVKFTAQGEVVIRWRLQECNTTRAMVEITVSDTGIGIAPENQARIFEGFSQAEASTTRRYGGTGLGLVISQRLIELMGGRLTLSSALGAGSTFQFVLGLSLPPYVNTVPAEDLGQAIPLPEVLLVDDNPVALATAVETMRAMQWQVTAASSGEAAVQLVQERIKQGSRDFDGVFVDWQMPGMDGWETLRNLRRLFGGRKTPKMIMLSGQGRELLTQRSHREQELLDGFLVKPLTARMFSEVLHGSVGLDKSHSEPHGAVGGLHHRLDGMHILVVEDNPINQQVAQELLSAQGARVTLADNGQAGVDAVAAANPQFDVVLMDLQMPVMGGLDAAKAIRLGLGLKDLPVIAMTANAMASDRQACLDAGMNDHVGKPFDLGHLLATLVRHTDWKTEYSPAVHPALALVSTAVDWPVGVDVVGALGRMGGNTGLLLRTIRAFVADANRLPEKLDGLIASDQQESAQRELHALKGLAATLGVADLSAAAAKAESALRQHQEVGGVGELLLQVHAAIVAAVPLLEAAALRLEALSLGAGNGEPLHSPTAAQADQGAIRGQLEALLLALRGDDMQAMELHAVLKQTFGEQLGETLNLLDGAMAELDFELAAVECDALIDHVTQ